ARSTAPAARLAARAGRMVLLLAVIVLSAAGPATAQVNPPTAPPPPTTSPPAAPSGVGQFAASPAAPNTGTVQSVTPAPAAGSAPAALPGLGIGQLPDLTKRENFSAAMQLIILLTVLSLAPAILIMMTSFTRIVIVLSLLRQALGTQSLPPNQVLIGLAMFMTFLVMGPTWQRVNEEALKPYMDGTMDQRTALEKAEAPVREFMIKQIVKGNNDADVDLFATFNGQPPPATWADVKTSTLIPAFMLSELKTAFLLGFKIYLPFLVIDIVISTVLISMGMMMLPPAMISLPFKLLLFVMVNGWHLITSNLLGSFAT
ncbi:MAG: Flagellar biosynthesis protein FliP, partial [uncultured Phycisphaerae bacterium]